MDCKICSLKYDEEEHRPRTLHCGHTLCSVCIAKSIREKLLRCPLCRKEQHVEVAEDIPVTFAILEAMEELTVNAAANYLPSPSLPLGSEQHAGVCTLHGSYRFFFCSQCKVCICHDCIVLEHPTNTCKVSSVKQAMQKIKEELGFPIKELEDMVMSYTNFFRNRQENLKDSVDSHDEQIKECLKVIEKQEKIKELIYEEKERNKTYLSAFEEILKKLVEAAEEMNDITSMENINFTLLNRKVLKGHFKECCEEFKGHVKECCEELKGHYKEWQRSSVDVLKVSQKARERLGILLKVIELEDTHPLLGLIDICQKVQQNPTPSDLLTARKFFDIFVESGDYKFNVTCDNHRLRIESLPTNVVSQNALGIPYSSISPYIGSSSEVFMELSWQGVKQGCVHIKIPNLNNKTQAFFQRFLVVNYGKRSSLINLNTVIINSDPAVGTLFFGFDDMPANFSGCSTIHTGYGHPNFNSGMVTLEMRENICCFYIHIRRKYNGGCLQYNNSHNYSGLFLQYNNSHKVSGLGVVVVSGLDIVERAITLPPMQPVTVTNCGIVLSPNASTV